MRLVFLLVEKEAVRRRLAEIMVRSVKKVMPGLEIVQLTDGLTESVSGVDTVVRKPMMYPWLIQFYMGHLKDLDGENIILDTDVVVLKDLRGVFDKPFDVALTLRPGRGVIDGKEWDMPYNSGVMFSRSRDFWKGCCDYGMTLSEEIRDWLVIQIAIPAVKVNYEVLDLPSDTFNYSPLGPDEDLSGKYAVHYKGMKRKGWMLEKYAA